MIRAFGFQPLDVSMLYVFNTITRWRQSQKCQILTGLSLQTNCFECLFNLNYLNNLYFLIEVLDCKLDIPGGNCKHKCILLD